ncbi:hypothetical protein DMC25_13165 [Caulobacter sp. D4A]|uniref:hypothetical protein n=1 Tax=unclassified Caulobacter TaxID=2648921 RepID=UPI000D73EB7C|nr:MULTISPECIES: hypothetical protein [unclassified Caulobacter]PXA86985.1 hypothetical protein DMC25_13165 [Caulobacter sp. D4A]PXA91419.1 hypothetical protein DMC18_13180 [Caulobacter sp. D5]
MKSIPIRLVAATLAATAAISGQALATPSETPTSQITFYGGGWTDAIVRVQLATAFHNPDGCPVTDGYIVDPAIGGAQMFASILLTAFTTNQPVRLVVDGCSYSRPKIIAINMPK